MKKITLNLTTNNIFDTENDFVEFLSVSADDIINFHHEKDSHSTLYYFEDDIHKIAFLLTQNKEIIKQFNMLKYNEKQTPIKSLDLFENYDVENIQINNLLTKLENNIAYFKFDFKGQEYSFVLARGVKAKNIFKKIEIILENNFSSGIDKKKMCIN